MILALIAVVIVLVVSFLIIQDGCSSAWLEVMAICAATISILIIFVYACVAYSYVAAGYKQKVINDRYGTNYSQEEVFYANDVIEEIRQLDRQRIEVNGNIFEDDGDDHSRCKNGK